MPRRRLGRVVLWLLAGLVALPVLAVLAITVTAYTVGWNWARAPLAERLGGRMGYVLAIDGDLDIDFGWVTRVTANGLRLGNPEWASRPDMAKVERLALDISVRDLLRGRLAFPAIVLTGPDIELERSAAHGKNWQANPATDIAAPEERTEFPVIGRLSIERGRIAYKDQVSGITLEADAATAEGQADARSPEISVKGRGEIDRGMLSFALVGGSILSLRENEEPYPIAIDVSYGDTKIQGKGTLDDPIALKGIDVQLAIEGGSARTLFAALGLTAPETPPYRIEGRLGKEGEVWQLRNFAGNVGSSDLAGSFRLDADKERPYLTADLTSKFLDFYDIGPLVGVPPGVAEGQPATAAQKEAARRVRQSPRVLPDAKLDIQGLRKFDADLRYRASEVKNIPVPISPVDLTVSLKDSVLSLKPFRFGFSGGTTEANITIDARKQPVRTDYDLRMAGMKLDLLMARMGLKDVASGTVRARIKLAGSGDSIRQSLATANGTVGATMGGGSISLLAMEVAGLDIAESLAFLGKKEKVVPVRCLALNMAVQNGIMETRAFVLDTTDTIMQGSGDISLRDEGLNLELVAQPKDFTPLSVRTPIVLKGTFKQPKPGINPAPVAARGAAAIALGVLLTPLASVLAFIDPGGGHDSDCQALIQSVPAQ